MSTKAMRIMIFGRPGAGKSTFAIKLSHTLGIPVYHLDRYFWCAHWQERPRDEFMEIQDQLVDQEQWIIDGNSIKSLLTRYERATHVIYFDYPRFTCYWRVVKRRCQKNRAIADRAEGCDEVLTWKMLTYIWSFNKRVSKPIADLRAMFPTTPYYRVTCDNELDTVLTILTKESHK